MAAIDGEHVRIIRERNGDTCSALADRLGISLTYLSDIELGRRTLKRSPGLVKKIAEELGVPTSMIERRTAADEAVA